MIFLVLGVLLFFQLPALPVPLAELPLECSGPTSEGHFRLQIFGSVTERKWHRNLFRYYRYYRKYRAFFRKYRCPVPGPLPGLLPPISFGTGLSIFLTGSGSGSTGSIGTTGPFSGTSGLAGVLL